MIMLKQRQHGFTLIELLVVISIIALLIAILLPALGAARSTARSAQCLSRMRNLSIAITSYEVENKGFLPPSYNGDGGAPLVGGGVGDTTYFSGFLDEYLETPDDDETDFYLCPDSTLEPASPTERRLSYSANDKALVNRMVELPKRMAEIKRASEIIAVGDSAQNSGNGSSQPAYSGAWIAAMGFPPDQANADRELEYDETLNVDGIPANGTVIRFRHNSGTSANHAFLDGHAETTKAGVLLERNMATNY
ncbi:MAG: prepilin-type N-terminal cleavage/methylation domain-containing protein [Planctomycetota bacterium]